MNHGQILRPDVVPVAVEYSQSPAAHPSAVALPVQGGMKLVVAGGLSKFEHATIQIAAHLVEKVCYKPTDVPGYTVAPELNYGELAGLAADVANAVLVECQRRQSAPPAG